MPFDGEISFLIVRSDTMLTFHPSVDIHVDDLLHVCQLFLMTHLQIINHLSGSDRRWEVRFALRARRWNVSRGAHLLALDEVLLGVTSNLG